jgi:hypothetical protein
MHYLIEGTLLGVATSKLIGSAVAGNAANVVKALPEKFGGNLVKGADGVYSPQGVLGNGGSLLKSGSLNSGSTVIPWSTEAVVAEVATSYGGTALPLPYTSVAGATLDYAWLSGQTLTGWGASQTAIPLGAGLRQVKVVGFKGTGGIEEAAGEGSIAVGLATGHFGLDFGDGVILGWHPSPVGGEKLPAMITKIKAGESRPGWIMVDKDLFEAAYKKNMTVLEAPVLMPEGQFLQVKEWYIANIEKPSATIQYAFPNAAPGWGVCTFNCVTYPRHHDILVPERFTGQVKNDIKVLENMLGVGLWEPRPTP